MSDIEHILSSDPIIEPSAEFTSRVMGQVRQEATAPQPIEFPWRRFLPGVITCAALILIVFGLMVANFDPAAVPLEPAPRAAPAFDVAMLGQAPAIAALALVGSLLVAWLAMRLAALPRRELF